MHTTPKPCATCGGRTFTRLVHPIALLKEEGGPVWRCVPCELETPREGFFRVSVEMFTNTLMRAEQNALDHQRAMLSALVKSQAVLVSLQGQQFATQVQQFAEELGATDAPAIRAMLQTLRRAVDECETAARELRDALGQEEPDARQA